jgi:hypothetical protein
VFDVLFAAHDELAELADQLRERYGKEAEPCAT